MTALLGTSPSKNHPDPYANIRGYLPATPFATAYTSHHSQNILPDAALRCLGALNCGYLSHAGGRAPTLLALKQHAQALAVLIRHLSVSTTAGEINAAHADAGARAFEADEAFDWLNDLETPYVNTDLAHHLPLTSLLNQVEAESEDGGPQFHCPLKEVVLESAEEKTVQKPYSTHHNLLMHASECLEVLDHEYSATGGIMSLLPTDTTADTVNLRAARNSLVGQWLLFTQHLVARMHELETSYGQSLDVLAGEAVIPAQTVSRLGPVGTHATGGARPAVFPQDKWILANAGDDVFKHLHRLFDVQEGQYEEHERIWRAAGVSGQRTWMEDRGGEEWSRGVVALDIVTRYYRLKGSGRGTVFVVPAWEFHPRCKATVEVERQPTVVAVPAPLWPARVSDWEARNRERLDEAGLREAELATAVKRVGQLTRQVELLKDEVRKANLLLDHYEEEREGEGPMEE